MTQQNRRHFLKTTAAAAGAAELRRGGTAGPGAAAVHARLCALQRVACGTVRRAASLTGSVHGAAFAHAAPHSAEAVAQRAAMLSGAAGTPEGLQQLSLSSPIVSR